MLYTISESVISETIIPDSVSVEPPTAYYPYRVEILSNDGGYIRDWAIGADGCPLSMVQYEETERGDVKCTIDIAEVTFPLNYSDIVKIYYNGKLDYIGYIEKLPDPRGGKIQVYPYIQRLKDILYNGSFSAKTPKEILETVITSTDSDTDVFWNSDAVDINVTDTYSPTYAYIKVEKIIDDWVKLEDDAVWGVDNGFLVVKKPDDDVKYTIFNDDQPPFVEIEEDNDSTKIEATEYRVFAKNASGDTDYVGIVPDGGTYPDLSLETDIGRKITGRLTAPDGLTGADALEWAYAKLKAYYPAQTVKITGLDRRLFDIKPFDKVRTWGNEELQLETIEDCEALTYWHGSDSLALSSDAKKGLYSVEFDTGTAKTELIYIDFERTRTYRGVEKLVFWIKSPDSATKAVAVRLGRYETSANYNEWAGEYASPPLYGEGVYWDTADNVSIRTVGAWNVIELSINPGAFQFIEFKSISDTDITIRIDEVQLYHFYQKLYELNVKTVKYKIAKSNYHYYDLELGSYDRKANDKLFEIERRLTELEEVTT